MTANLCLGTRDAVREKVGDFFTHLVSCKEEFKRRCRTILRARAAEPTSAAQTVLSATANSDFTLTLVYCLVRRSLHWERPSWLMSRVPDQILRRSPNANRARPYAGAIHRQCAAGCGPAPWVAGGFVQQMGEMPCYAILLVLF